MRRWPFSKKRGVNAGRPSSLSPYQATGRWNLPGLKGLRQVAASRVDELVVPTRLDLWLAVLVVTGALGFLGIVVGFLKGHENVFGVERGVPWGILIATYMFFATTASGLCLISSLGHVFGIRTFEPLGAKAHLLAIVSLIAGFTAIGAELERPWRLFVFAALTPNFASPIWWMGTLYTFEFTFQIVEFQFLNRGNMARRSNEISGPARRLFRWLALGSSDTSTEALRRNMRLARWAGIGGVTFAILATSTLGTVFGLVEARPWWSGAYMPVYLILSALVSAVAVLGFFGSLSYGLGEGEITTGEKGLMVALGRLLPLFLGALVLFIVWNAIERLYGDMPGKSEALMLLVAGPLSLPFWGLEILVGILVPFFILLHPRTRTTAGVGIASLLVLIGQFAARYDLVIAGQLVPVAGSMEALHYTPSYTEWLIVGGIFSLCAFLYTFADKALPRRDIHMDLWE
ncbi:MAG: polysulfide reductase NrfD [Chloroflexi bacterium]|nr:polysulfide reductase NrfD [Chloroflexota bacterium]